MTRPPKCPVCGGSGKAKLALPTNHQKLPGHGSESDELDWRVTDEKYPCLDCGGTGTVDGPSGDENRAVKLGGPSGLKEK